jgi:hypothetical protein
MKKRVLFVAALFIGAAAFAQDGLTSKKGEAYLPEAGDWAIGFDANPFINYFGNLANGNTANSIAMPWQSGDMILMGKYFKDEKTAYRMSVRIGFGSTKSDSIFKTLANPNDLEMTEFTNESKTSNMNIAFGGGIEKRRGNTRIQGFYGGELMFMFGNFGNDNQENTYGLALSDSATAGGATRNLKTTAGKTFGINLRGFVGVEWFVAPKVSIAAEYGWGLTMSSTGDGETTTERWGVTATEAFTNLTAATPIPDHNVAETVNTGGSGSFGIDTDNGAMNAGSNARLTLLFHF